MLGCAVLVLGRQPSLGVLCWCVAHVLHQASCAGVSPTWSGVLCWCMAHRHGQTCSGGVWPASMVGRAVLVCRPLWWLCVVCWCLAWVGGVLAAFWSTCSGLHS